MKRKRNEPFRSTEERFWSKVRKADGCWEWTASTDSHGYGQFYRGPRRTPGKAHRVSWELRNGPVVGGLFVCHRCDNPRCVNPDHLFLGDQADNMRDCAAKGRSRGPRKLTEERVREMRRMLAEGDSQASVARRFGVSPSNISHVARRKTWAHV